jgi:hypothetical protein
VNSADDDGGFGEGGEGALAVCDGEVVDIVAAAASSSSKQQQVAASKKESKQSSKQQAASSSRKQEAASSSRFMLLSMAHGCLHSTVSTLKYVEYHF